MVRYGPTSEVNLTNAKVAPSYLAQVIQLNSALTSLSKEFQGAIPAGEVHQLAADRWGNHEKMVGRDAFGDSLGAVRSWRYLALTSDGLRVIEESRLASPHGEESLRSREAVSAPNMLTAMRLAGSVSAEELRSRIEAIVGASSNDRPSR